MGLLIAALNIVARGLSDFTRGVEPTLLSSMAVLGALIGLGLALTPLSGLFAGLLTGLLGLTVIMIRVGRIGPEFLELINRYSMIRGSVWNLGTETQKVDGIEIARAWKDLGVAINILFTRFIDWLVDLTTGTTSFDPVVSALLWCAVLYAVAAWAGWATRRRKQPLYALVPAGVLLALTLEIVGAKPDPLLWLLGITFPVLALVAQDVRQRRWRQVDTHFPQRLWRNLTIWAVLLSVVLVSAAAVIQDFSFRKFIRDIQKVTSEQVPSEDRPGKVLGLVQEQQLDPEVQAFLDRLSSPGLPQRHLIGSGPELSDQLVMMIQIQEEGTEENLIDGLGPVTRYYWRSRTYDVYTGLGWKTNTTEKISYQAGQLIQERNLPSHRLVRQVVQSASDLRGLVYAAGSLVTVDNPFIVDWRSDGDAFGAILQTADTSNQIDSLVLEVDQEQLRATGGDYPEWIQTRYLHLPETVPDRVLSLARNLTATAPTRYDRAVVIEEYLRGFEYTLDLPSPPSNRDVVDYFLFDLQKGYCDYFATSMVVLARAAGLPARLVIGYGSGIYDADLNAFLVTEAEAHSWPEIYFPGYGWIEFEPTSGRQSIERSETTTSSLSDDIEDLLSLREVESPGVGFKQNSLVQLGRHLLIISFIVLVVMGAAWVVTYNLRLRRLSTTATAMKVFQLLYRNGIQLDIATYPGDTPYEFADALIYGFDRFSLKPQWRNLLTPVTQDVRRIVDSFVQATYSPHTLADSNKTALLRSWRRLRWRLWLVRIQTRFNRLKFRGVIRRANYDRVGEQHYRPG